MQQPTHRFHHTFTVRGDGQFPVDLLRLDRCYPHTPEDSAFIQRPSRGPRAVTLEHVDFSWQWEPSRFAWAEAGWKLVSHEWRHK